MSAVLAASALPLQRAPGIFESLPAHVVGRAHSSIHLGFARLPRSR